MWAYGPRFDGKTARRIVFETVLRALSNRWRSGRGHGSGPSIEVESLMAVPDSWPRPLRIALPAVKLVLLFLSCHIVGVDGRDPISAVFLFVSYELNDSILRFVPINHSCLPALPGGGKTLENLKPAVCRFARMTRQGAGKPLSQSEFLLCLNQSQH